MKNLFLIIILSFLFQIGYSQGIIEIENPSYEGTPRHSFVAAEWLFCNFNGESPPDIQPGVFEVHKEAFDGYTYLGLVTRDNGTFEMIQKKLEKPLVKETCYTWNFYLSQSLEYFSISRTTLQPVMFTEGVNVVIYGSKTADCKSMEPLAIAENIKKMTEWKPYQFIFNAKEAYEYLIISVQPANPKKPVNGHILIDYFTPLIPIDCETKKPKDVIVNNNNTILKDIRQKKGEEKLKALIKEINIDSLTKKGYLDYQLYMNEENKLTYDNLYFNELMRSIPKGKKKEIIFMTKNEYKGNIVINYLESYMKQRKLDANFLMIYYNKKKDIEKYRKEFPLLFEGEDVVIFLK